MFPSVAFRPVRLLMVCLVLTAVAVVAAYFAGTPLFGVFFGVGLGLGLLNALLVRRAVESITAGDHPLKKKMAVNSATRLLAITAIGLAIAFFFKAHGGVAVLFGLAIFQALLVMSTSIPVMRKIRSDGLDVERSREDHQVAPTESKD